MVCDIEYSQTQLIDVLDGFPYEDTQNEKLLGNNLAALLRNIRTHNSFL